MSSADIYFRDQIKKIREAGFNDREFRVRPHWSDGTPAHTIKVFGYITRYNLREEFPILTIRKQAFKGAVKELLWIFQKKSTNIHDLDTRIWDA